MWLNEEKDDEVIAEDFGLDIVHGGIVRRFNRGRKRDGPLVRGRFLSRPVHSLEYREVLVRYIDRNPVQAAPRSKAPAFFAPRASWIKHEVEGSR